MGLIAPISAISSLEGYKYQGNVALLVALSEIKKLIQNSDAIDEYVLQIEGAEDFSLLKNGSYISLHQVKSGAVDVDDNDKFAFIAEIIQNNADYGFFHVKTSKKIPVDFLDKALSVIYSLQVEFQKNIVSKRQLSVSDNEDDYIVLEEVTATHKKATKYSIIKYVTGGKNDRASVEEAIVEIKDELQQYLDVINSKKSQFISSAPGEQEDKCFLCEWPQKFDDSNEMKKLGTQVIKDIITMVKPQCTFADDGYCRFLYEQGILIIEQYVTDFFIQKDKNGKCLIPYSGIYNLIFHDFYHDLANTEFKYYLILKNIDEVFKSFARSICNQTDCSQCSYASTCNLWRQFKKWSGRDNDAQHQFVFNLLLQAPTVEISELPNNETIKIQLMDLVKAVSTLSLNDKNVIAASLDKNIYWLSLDDSRTAETLRDKIQKGLRENSDKSFLYECDTLITSFLNKSSFKLDGSNVNVLEQAQLDELKNIITTNIEDERANCNKPKIIQLVDAAQAKGDLA